MPRGGRRQGAGRSVGSKNRIPKSKDAVNRLNDIVTELETGAPTAIGIPQPK